MQHPLSSCVLYTTSLSSTFRLVFLCSCLLVFNFFLLLRPPLIAIDLCLRMRLSGMPVLLADTTRHYVHAVLLPCAHQINVLLSAVLCSLFLSSSAPSIMPSYCFFLLIILDLPEICLHESHLTSHALRSALSTHCFHSLLRQIVPFSPAEQSKGGFINFLAKSGNNIYTHKPSSQKALDGLARMISLFVEHFGPKDAAYAAALARSSSSKAKTNVGPFSKDVWPERVRVAAQQAQAWRNGDPVGSGKHHLHCDAVSAIRIISVFAVAVLTPTLNYLTVVMR